MDEKKQITRLGLLSDAQQSFDPRHDDIHRHGIQAAFGDDDIGIALGRLDKFQVHGADGGQVLVDDRLGGATALGDVALQAADEADIGIRIDEDLDIEQLAQLGFGKDQDAFHQDDRLWLDADGLRGARVGLEIVDRQVNLTVFLELSDMGYQQAGIQRVGVVEVDAGTLGGSQVAEVFVVSIVRQVGDMLRTDPFQNDICDGCLSGSGTASNADDNGGCIGGHTGIILEEY